MRHITPLERGIFLLGVFLIVVGILVVFHPTEVTVSHQGYRVVDTGLLHVSESGAQGFGIIAALFGVFFLWIALSAPRK